MLYKLTQLVTPKRVLLLALLIVFVVAMFAPLENLAGKVEVAHAAGLCDEVSNCLTAIVYLFSAYLMSGVAYIASYVFNFGIVFALNSNSYALDFISQGWALVRDIANLSFIFILIYIAYTIIVQAETAGTMKMLAGVIVMALLINFSFFLTRVVIDAGNILAVQIYNAIDAKDPATGLSATIASPLGGANAPQVKDMSVGIMNAIKIQGLMSSDSFAKFITNNSFLVNVGMQILVYCSVAALLATVAWVFVYIGLKFIVRVITLWFVIIAAPLAFAARAMPGRGRLRGYYDSWQQHLVESSFYPAVFLFLFYIINLFMLELGGVGGIVPNIFTQANAEAAKGADGLSYLATLIANVAIRLGLVSIMLYAAVQISDALSSQGSATIKNGMSWVGKRVNNSIPRSLPNFSWAPINRTATGAAPTTRASASWNTRNALGRTSYGLIEAPAVKKLGTSAGVSGPGTQPLLAHSGAGLERQQQRRGIQAVAKQNQITGPTTPVGKAVDVEKGGRDFEAFKRNHAGGEAGFESARKELESRKAFNERLLKSGATQTMKDSAQGELTQINEKLQLYTDEGKAKLAHLDEERTKRLADRLNASTDRAPDTSDKVASTATLRDSGPKLNLKNDAPSDALDKVQKEASSSATGTLSAANNNEKTASVQTSPATGGGQTPATGTRGGINTVHINQAGTAAAPENKTSGGEAKTLSAMELQTAILKKTGRDVRGIEENTRNLGEKIAPATPAVEAVNDNTPEAPNINVTITQPRAQGLPQRLSVDNTPANENAPETSRTVDLKPVENTAKKPPVNDNGDKVA